jgi:hypothetical protein
MKFLCRITRVTGLFRNPRKILTPLFIETFKGWEEVGENIIPQGLSNYQGELPPGDYAFVDLEQGSSKGFEAGLTNIFQVISERSAELKRQRTFLQDWQDNLTEQSKKISDREVLIANFQEQFLPLQTEQMPTVMANYEAQSF